MGFSYRPPQEPKTYYAGLVWAVLNSHPGSTAKECAAFLKWRVDRTSCMLNSLRRDGHARNEGVYRSRNQKWYAVGDRPNCGWGCNLNSLANLNATEEQQALGRRRAYIARGLDPDKLGKARKPSAKPRKLHALDKCWSLYISATQDKG